MTLQSDKNKGVELKKDSSYFYSCFTRKLKNTLHLLTYSSLRVIFSCTCFRDSLRSLDHPLTFRHDRQHQHHRYNHIFIGPIWNRKQEMNFITFHRALDALLPTSKLDV